MSEELLPVSFVFNNCTILDANEFQTLAAESGWNSEEPMAAYHQGLADEIKDQFATQEESN